MFDFPQATADFHFAYQPRDPFVRAASGSAPAPITYAPRPLSVEKRRCHEIVNALGEMEEDWDGYGALSIDPRTVKNASTALDRLLEYLPAPDITPNSNGTISFEWESSDGVAYLEIGMTRFSMYIRRNSGGVIPIDGAAENMNAAIGVSISMALFPPRQGSSTITKLEFTKGDVRATA